MLLSVSENLIAGEEVVVVEIGDAQGAGTDEALGEGVGHAK